jgi:hypothetical protein
VSLFNAIAKARREADGLNDDLKASKNQPNIDPNQTLLDILNAERGKQEQQLAKDRSGQKKKSSAGERKDDKSDKWSVFREDFSTCNKLNLKVRTMIEVLITIIIFCCRCRIGTVRALLKEAMAISEISDC